MSITSFSNKIRPTRGELLKLKSHLEALKEGLTVLTMKRDKLSETLQLAIKNISDKRMNLEEVLSTSYDALISAYVAGGSSEIEMQAASVQGMLNVRVLPQNIMGTIVPKIEVSNRPELKGKLGTIAYGVGRRFFDLIDDVLKVAEMEAEVIQIADELHKTNRKINALEQIIIPNLMSQIRYIDELLEEESLEEFTRTKKIRNIIDRRRS